MVAVSGAVDVATAQRLRQALQAAQYGGGQRLAVDLDGVEFLDSFGLGVLVGGLKRARGHGGQFAVCCRRDRLRQLLALTRLDTIRDVVADVDDLPRA